MRRRMTLILPLFLPIVLLSQTGQVIESLSFKSIILGMERKYAIYLPPDYNISDRKYPVLYLLHGKGEDQTEWIQCGEVLRIADECILNGKATAMIIVMPDANSGIRGYVNDAAGKWRYEDFFFEELVPHVEQKFRIRSEKRFRAISGLSMGGGGTFLYALHRPDLFTAACPLSAASRTLENPDTKKFIEENIRPNATEEQVSRWIKKYDIHGLIKNMPDEQKEKVRWYIDCGDDDFLYEGNSLIHIAMKKNKIPHEFRVRDGKHDWTYWRSALPEVLNFVCIAFHEGVD